MSGPGAAAPLPAPPPAEAPARRHALEVLASVAFLLYLAALPWSIAAMSVTGALCAALTVAWWGKARPRWRPPLPLLLPALGWLAALLWAALFAEDRAASLPRVLKGGLPAVAFVAAYHARERRGGEKALGVLLVSGAAAALYALLEWIGRGGEFPERARGASGHYMTLGGQLLLWIPVATGIAMAARRRGWQVLAVLGTGIGAVALAATYTRSAWIGTFLALALMLFVSRPRALLALALVTAAAIAVAPASYRDRLASAFDPAHATNVERRHMWEAGVRMFLDRPLTGVGLQDLHPVYDRYRSPEAREGAGHLHSVFVQIAATMGVPGVLAFLALYAALFRITASGREPAPGAGVGAGLRLGVTGALAGFLVAGLFEWNFGDEELLHLLYALAGMAWSAAGWSAAPGREAERP